MVVVVAPAVGAGLCLLSGYRELTVVDQILGYWLTSVCSSMRQRTNQGKNSLVLS